MFVIALLPILWLVLAMCVLKMSAWKACSLALVISLIVAIPVFGMVKNNKHQTRALMDESRHELDISESLKNLITKFVLSH